MTVTAQTMTSIVPDFRVMFIEYFRIGNLSFSVRTCKLFLDLQQQRESSMIEIFMRKM